MTFTIEPVALVEASRTQPEDDFWGGTEACITLADDMPEDALDGIEAFSHVEVTFVFHQVDETRVTQGARHPRNDPDLPRVGIFAQRAKRRPNRLGSTVCRVIRREGRRLIVAELDAIDGTPVVDLRPVMREFLPREEVVQPAWVAKVMQNYWRHPVEARSEGQAVPAVALPEGDDAASVASSARTVPAGVVDLPSVVDVAQKFAMFDEPWAPRVVAELNDHQIKLAKFRGPFVWHVHRDVDEAFLVIDGAMRIEFRSGIRHLEPGRLCVVPSGVEHRPVADEECHVMLIEPRGVTNTGDTDSELRAANDVWV